MSTLVDLEVPPCGGCFGPAYLGRGGTMRCLRCLRSEGGCSCRKPAAAEYHVCPPRHFDAESDPSIRAIEEAEKEEKLQALLKRNSVLDLLRREWSELRARPGTLNGCRAPRRGGRSCPVLMGEVAGVEMLACTVCGWATKTDPFILQHVEFGREVS
jgi:hypothetical protein